MGCAVAMKANAIQYSQAELKEMFDYVNGDLVWRRAPEKQNRLLGLVAGCIHGSGYRVIRINGQAYQAHRLIWIYNNGSIDKELSIDHIDGNKLNNSLENLRVVNQQQNCFNRSRLNAKGYTWNKQTKKWQAYISIENKLKHLGCFIEEQDARNAYLQAASYRNI